MKKPVPLGTEAHTIERFRLGGQMNVEEVRMNKALLKEISEKKKSPPKHEERW